MINYFRICDDMIHLRTNILFAIESVASHVVSEKNVLLFFIQSDKYIFCTIIYLILSKVKH